MDFKKKYGMIPLVVAFFISARLNWFSNLNPSNNTNKLIQETPEEMTYLNEQNKIKDQPEASLSFYVLGTLNYTLSTCPVRKMVCLFAVC